MKPKKLFPTVLLVSTPYLSLGQYEYADLSYSYHLKWNGKCTPVPAGVNYNYRKGNSYEINHESYLAFHICKSYFSCDRSVEHAVRMDDYFRATSACVGDYCSSCDGEGCAENCEKYGLMAAATIDDGNSTYNGCSATTSSEGLRYYYGPQCTDDGDLTMGYFFDKHCQLNATRRRNIYSPDSFIAFDVFNFVRSICSDCSYFGVCEDIYTTSYSCSTDNGTLLSVGENFEIGDESEEGYDYEQEDNNQVDDDEMRSTTVSFAENVCLEVNTIEHLKEELLRNTTFHYMKQGGIALKDLTMIVCGVGAVLIVGFLFVAHTYHARHKAPWAKSKRGALNDEWKEGKSFDEISCDSTDAGFSAIDEQSFPSQRAKC